MLQFLERLQFSHIDAIFPGSVFLFQFFDSNQFLSLDILSFDDCPEGTITNFFDFFEFVHKNNIY